MTKDEALKLALEAFDYIEHNYMSLPAPATKAIAAIREALASPVATNDTSQERVDETAKQRHEQEPVAHTLNCICGAVWDVSPDGVEEMVHAPNPPHRKPLSDEMKSQCPYGSILQGAFYDGWLKAEAAHGIKE